MRRAVLLLGRLTGFGLTEMLALTWQELCDWLEEAGKLEEEINARA